MSCYVTKTAQNNSKHGNLEIEYDWNMIEHYSIRWISMSFLDISETCQKSHAFPAVGSREHKRVHHSSLRIWKAWRGYFFLQTPKMIGEKTNSLWKKRSFLDCPFCGQSTEAAPFCIWQDMVKPTDLSLSASAAYGSSACLLSSPWFQGFCMVLQRILNMHKFSFSFARNNTHKLTNTKVPRAAWHWKYVTSRTIESYSNVCKIDGRWKVTQWSKQWWHKILQQWWMVTHPSRWKIFQGSPSLSSEHLRSAWWSQRQ